MKRIIVFTAAILLALSIFIFRVHTALYPPMPSNVKVGAFVYTLSESADITFNGELGLTSCDKLMIFIQKGLPVSKQREVVMHELLHTSYCIPTILKDDEKEPKYTQEESVYLSASQVVMILRDNPDLQRYLFN